MRISLFSHDSEQRIGVLMVSAEGIGAGIALRLAQAGASVQIVGRNRVLADQLILKMEDASPKGTVTPPSFEFLQADLWLVVSVG